MGRFRFYKVGRELKRLSRQFYGFPAEADAFLRDTNNYDRFHAPQTKRTTGDAILRDKLAIFVIYPKIGLQKSHSETIDYFTRNGFAVLVVSNAPLSADDLGRLKPITWHVLERQNFGYDFGGYRDGFRFVADRLPALKELVLVNDSTWFPLPGSRDWLGDVRALGVDFAGASTHYGHGRPDEKTFRQIEWTTTTGHRNFQYASFGLWISGAILADQRFAKFWDNYRLTDDKSQTVRRGEVGLTRWVLKHGYRHGATFDTSDLDARLSGLSDARLDQIARNIVLITDAKLLLIKSAWLAGRMTLDRKETIALILAATARQGVAYAPVDFAVVEAGFPFLKKSPMWLTRIWRP